MISVWSKFKVWSWKSSVRMDKKVFAHERTLKKQYLCLKQKPKFSDLSIHHHHQPTTNRPPTTKNHPIYSIIYFVEFFEDPKSHDHFAPISIAPKVSDSPLLIVSGQLWTWNFEKNKERSWSPLKLSGLPPSFVNISWKGIQLDTHTQLIIQPNPQYNQKLVGCMEEYKVIIKDLSQKRKIVKLGGKYYKLQEVEANITNRWRFRVAKCQFLYTEQIFLSKFYPKKCA